MSLHPIEESAQWQRPDTFINEYGECLDRPPVIVNNDMYGETTIIAEAYKTNSEKRLADIQAEVAELASQHMLTKEDEQQLEELDMERLLVETDIAFQAERLAHPDAVAALEIWLEGQLEEFVRVHPGATLDEKMQAEISLLAEYLGSHLGKEYPYASSEGLIHVAQVLHDELITLYGELRPSAAEQEVPYLVSNRPEVAA